MNAKKDFIYKNPFPVTAVANFYNNMQNNIIVETKAIKKIKKIIDKWILDENDGITIAIQGEYGTGKTQLAIEMQRYINKSNENKYHFICLDSPSNSFLEMYKNRFLNELTKAQVLERLEACYYEIIVNDKESDEIYKKLFESKNNIKSTELIERFGLAKSKYDLIFEEKLVNVTQNSKFVSALLLLLDARFEKEVWDWFNGSEPSDAMKERGVNFSIDNDAVALESIGIFAFLFGQQGHRFVLFIDEMEKIVSSTEKIKKDSFGALKKLIEIVKATKSMLILCGLPDYYIALPRDTQQRIAYQIKTGGIMLSEIEEYIRNANEKVNNKKTQIPFCKEILEEILDISNGNIRTIIRLLYHSGNWYIENSIEINSNALCDILTNAYGTFDLTAVRKVLAQIFTSKGWLFEERKSSDKATIDFWLPYILTKKDSLNDGIEIYLVSNLLSEEEYTQVNKRICTETNNCKICVVEGFINEHFYKRLSQENKHIFKYRVPEYRELLISFIEGEKAKHENSIKQNDFSQIKEKIEQLSWSIKRTINDLSENTISKEEFYYFARNFFDIKKEEFYSIPDKDSECYLLISEIHKIIDALVRNINEKDEKGAVYLFREFSYVLYYFLERPEKIQIAINNVDVYKVCRNIYMFTDSFSRRQSSTFKRTIEKYMFVLKYMCLEYEDKEKIMYRYKDTERGLLLLDMTYEKDFFSVSNRLKQISQVFCAELLASRPVILEKYFQLFVSFYYFMYVVEPAIIKREVMEFDIEILREYYDLLKQYFKSYNIYKSRESLERLFQNYENGLRRLNYEREY